MAAETRKHDQDEEEGEKRFQEEEKGKKDGVSDVFDAYSTETETHLMLEVTISTPLILLALKYLAAIWRQ